MFSGAHTQIHVRHAHTRTHGCSEARVFAPCPVSALDSEPPSLPFQQAKKGLLTLTVRTRLTAPHAPSGHPSPPLCRSLSSGSCAATDGGPFLVGDAEAAASARTPSCRVLVEVSLTKGSVCRSRLCGPSPGLPLEPSPQLPSPPQDLWGGAGASRSGLLGRQPRVTLSSVLQPHAVPSEPERPASLPARHPRNSHSPTLAAPAPSPPFPTLLSLRPGRSALPEPPPAPAPAPAGSQGGWRPRRGQEGTVTDVRACGPPGDGRAPEPEQPPPSVPRGRRGPGHRPVQRAPRPGRLRHLHPHALAGVGGPPGRAAAVGPCPGFGEGPTHRGGSLGLLGGCRSAQ